MTWWRDAGELGAKLAAHGWNATVLSEVEGCDRTTIVKWMGRLGVHRPEGMDARTNWRPPKAGPPPIVEISHTRLELEGDFAVSSDWHAPLTKYDVFHRFLEDSAKAGLTRGICAGDLTNQDALSGHEDKQGNAGMSVEIPHLHYQVDTALDVFDELYVTFGNHDRHLAQKAKVDFERSIRMLLADMDPEKRKRIKVTSLDSVIVHTSKGPWLICHTRSYSRIPLHYPNKLALRHGMHVAAGHRHHHAIGKAANGKTIVELGGFQDEARMDYANKYTNDMPMMSNGYGLLIDGGMRCPMLAD